MTLDTAEAAPTPASEPAIESTPETAAEPTFESGEQYFESLERPDTPTEPEPQRRRSPLEDPRVGQHLQTYKERAARYQGQMEVAIDELVGYGVPEASAKRIVNDHKGLLNQNHSDGIQFGGYQAALEALEAESADMHQGFAQVFTKAELQSFEAATGEIAKANNGSVPWGEVAKNVVAVARKGYIAEKDHKAAVVAAFNKGQAQRAEVGTASTNKPLGLVTGAASGKAPKTLAEARALHVRGEISNDTYRDYQTKLS